MNYSDLSPNELVDLFADKRRRNDAIVALVGGITATELRTVTVSGEAKAALITGLKHPNSKVRWWCIQLMDHLANESYLHPLLNAAKTDSTPKNRRHAIHALTCGVCKPNQRALEIDIRSELEQIAETDEDLSVKLLALQELAEIAAPSE